MVTVRVLVAMPVLVCEAERDPREDSGRLLN